MICRKINYSGTFDDAAAGELYDIVRKVDICGIVTKKSPSQMELILEGDPSMIKLIEHLIAHSPKLKYVINNKIIIPHEFQKYSDLSFQVL